MVNTAQDARDSREAVAAAVKAYRSDADIAKLLARLDAVCTATDDTGALLAAIEPFRELHEVAGPVYERVIEREPDNARVLVALANAYWLTGRGPDVVGALASRAAKLVSTLAALTRNSPRERVGSFSSSSIVPSTSWNVPRTVVTIA